MPTLSVIAIYVSSTNWIQYEFADKTRSQPVYISDWTIERLAADLDAAAWGTLQIALRNRENWITVKG